MRARSVECWGPGTNGARGARCLVRHGVAREHQQPQGKMSGAPHAGLTFDGLPARAGPARTRFHQRKSPDIKLFLLFFFATHHMSLRTEVQSTVPASGRPNGGSCTYLYL